MTFSGLSAHAKVTEVQLCELLVSPSPQYGSVVRAMGRFANLAYQSSAEVNVLVDELRELMPIERLPLRARSVDGRIAVYGGSYFGTPDPQAVMDEITSFDRFAASFGFIIPEKTKVIVSGFTGLPSVFANSPYAWRLKHFVLLDLRSDFVHAHLAYARPVIAHERTHLIMDRTYGRFAFVETQMQVGEALADFLPALYLDLPPAQYMKTLGVERGQDASDKMDGPHTMLLPEILWKISRHMPREAMRAFLPAMIVAMNRNHAGADCQVHVGEYEPSRSFLRERNRVAVLMLAIAERLRPDLDFLDLIDEVEKVTNLSVTEVYNKLGEMDSLPPI